MVDGSISMVCCLDAWKVRAVRECNRYWDEREIPEEKGNVVDLGYGALPNASVSTESKKKEKKVPMWGRMKMPKRRRRRNEVSGNTDRGSSV